MTEFRYALRGEVDLAMLPQLRLGLGRAVATGKHLLVDCTDLTFIDSSAIAALLEANLSLRAEGKYMLIANVPRSQRRTFELLGLSDLLHYDREDA